MKKINDIDVVVEDYATNKIKVIKSANRISLSMEDYSSLVEKSKKYDIIEAVKEYLTVTSGYKCIIEDKQGNLIYPFSQKQLIEFKHILSNKKYDSNEFQYDSFRMDDTHNNKQLFEYYEDEKTIVIDNKKQNVIFKGIRNITHHQDYLTGLDKREVFVIKFETYLMESLGRKGSFAYFFMDLNNFKSVNDDPRYGHSGGDAALKAFGQILKDSIRNDDLVARFAGDEFIMVLKDVSIEDALNKASEIAQKYKTAKIENKGIIMDFDQTVSIGIYYVDTRLFDREEVQKISHIKDVIRDIADKNVYNSKKGGNDSITITSNMDGGIQKSRL